MSKNKTHKGTLKRVRITSKGKVTHKRAGTSHLMSSFSGKRKRKMRNKLVAHKSIAKMMEGILRRRLVGRDEA